MSSAMSKNRSKSRWQYIVLRLSRSRQCYVMLIIPVIYLILFKYIPMYGVQIAFKDFIATKGIEGSPWVGLAQFERFFTSIQFKRVLPNTLYLSLYQLIAGFPMPILLALSLNSTLNRRYGKVVQMVTYMPHFISMVVMVGIVIQFLNPHVGIIGKLVSALNGGKTVDLMGKPQYFRSIYVWSGIWQTTGWGTIVYLAALASVSMEIHEAATIDGANRVQRIWHVDIPGILPTAVILLIMNTGRIMDVGFEKALLMQNNLNLRVSEIIQTYVYKIGLASNNADFSYAAAIGLFNSAINFILIIIVNQIARRLGDTSLW